MKTTRTTIKQENNGYVRLTYTDEGTSVRTSRTFRAPRASGYVQEWDEYRQEWRQVFGPLGHKGWALTASQEKLLDVIRKEWRKMKRDERRQLAGEVAL